ncbi:MAG: PAS domain-containing sensor histidine kinase [Comamonadaceae bacterium]|nr:MAG: PAS domain-containing sensor histidine kinase [Comamonadaceae bacterium]
MSERVRQFDWSRNALGPIEQWPVALRLSVESLLASHFATCLMWGPDLVTIYNDAFRVILGNKPESLGRPVKEVWSEVWDSIGPIAERALAGQATFIEDFELEIDRYGHPELAYFTFCYSPVRDEQGEVVGMLDTVIETTGKMVAEALAREATHSLEKQVAARTADRNRLWMRSDALLMVARFDGGVAAVNPAWTAVLGWTETETVGRHASTFVHPEDMPVMQRELKALEQGAARRSGTLRYRHRDGSVRWITWTAVPGDGFIQAVGRDVTDERAQSDALRHAEDQLRQSQKMEALGQLTGGIAHDLNNMLQGVVLPLQLIRQRVAQQRYGEVGRYVEAGLASSRRAASLTQRLLAFSRRQPLDSRALGLQGAFDGLQALLKSTCGENIALELDLPPEVWNVDTDAHQFDSAIINLAINARDAMPDGGQLRIAARNVTLAEALPQHGLEPGDYVQLSVTDTGSGMPQSVVQRAFDPFFTTKPIGQGTGLGLSMIYGYMRQSGGAVVLDSEEGRGTAIALYFRRAGEVADLEDSVPLSDAPGTKRRDSVLVVEDDETVRALAVELLKDMGFQVMQASNGNEAMALLSGALQFDLLVSDVGLPGPNGRQVADYAREKLPSIRVILMTGYAEQAAMNPRFLSPGMELLVKPFDAQALVSKVQALVGHASA